MMNRAILAATLLALLAGCGGDSGLNPLRWLGSRSETETLVPVEAAALPDTRPLMYQVTSLRLDPTYTGAILRATGLAPTQGWWAGELVAEERAPAPPGSLAARDVLTYTFRAVPPPGPTRVSTPQSREVVVGLTLTNRELAGVREIRVRGDRNALAVRR